MEADLGTLMWIAQCIVDQLASLIKEFGCTEIWNNCYDVMVAWKKTVGNMKVQSCHLAVLDSHSRFLLFRLGAVSIEHECM